MVALRCEGAGAGGTMDFELKLEKPALNRAWISALVMGLSYFLSKLLC